MRVNCVHKLGNALAFLGVGWIAQRWESGSTNDWNLVAIKSVLGEQFTNFHLNQFKQFLVIDKVTLVQEHNKRWNANLARQQNVLLGLRHRAVGCAHHQNGAVHLRGAGDHVLHIIGVAWAINVRVMAALGFVLNVAGGDSHDLCWIAAAFAFAGLGNGVVRDGLAQTFGGLNCGDCRGESCLTVIDVSDRADIDVWFCAIEIFFSHDIAPIQQTLRNSTRRNCSDKVRQVARATAFERVLERLSFRLTFD